VTTPSVDTLEADAPRAPRPWWREAFLLFVVYQAFERTRGILPEPAGTALRHAEQLVRLERALGIFREAAIQRWFLPWHPVIEVFDFYYGTVHFVVPVAALVVLWRMDKDRYRRARNAFGFMLALALPCFAFWPLTPPRLLPPPPRFVDTAATIGGMGALDRGNMKDDNEVAAMPSLHIGWSSWCVVVLWPVVRRRWAKVALVAYPLVTLLVVVVTANHYVLDGAGGLVVLGGGLVLEAARRRLRPGRGGVAGRGGGA
jgi:hypothetical protein